MLNGNYVTVWWFFLEVEKLQSLVKPANLERNYSETSEERTPKGLKLFFAIEKCPLLGGNLTKTVTFGTKCFDSYSRHIRYLILSLLGGFTTFDSVSMNTEI